MAKKRFEEDGTPLKHTYDTMTFDHLGKKVEIKVGGLETNARIELEKIIGKYLEKGEEPTMLVDSVYPTIGMRKNKDGTCEVYEFKIEEMSVEGRAPYYKVGSLHGVETFSNHWGAMDEFRIRSAQKFLKYE